jgi:hypothetical protein
VVVVSLWFGSTRYGAAAPLNARKQRELMDVIQVMVKPKKRTTG